METLSALEWAGGQDGVLRILDQTRLPAELVWLECRDVDSVFGAIRRLSVRGAPAIGIAAAFGCVIGAQAAAGRDEAAVRAAVTAAGDHLATSRPTAVNLFWAIKRMQRVTPMTLDALLAEV